MSILETIVTLVTPVLNKKVYKKYVLGKVAYELADIESINQFYRDNNKANRIANEEVNQTFALRKITALNDFSLAEMLFLIDKKIDLDGIQFLQLIKYCSGQAISHTFDRDFSK